MKKLSLCLALILTACGNTYPQVATVGYSYMNPNYASPPIQNNTLPYYYCYYNSMIVRRNTFHPRFNNKWIYAPYEICL